MRCPHCGCSGICYERDGELVCLLCSRVQNPIAPLPFVQTVFLPGLWQAKDREGYTRKKYVTNPILDNRGKYKRKSHQTVA